MIVDNVKKLSNNNFLIQNQDYAGQYSEVPWINEYCKILEIKPKYHLISPELIMDDLYSTFLYQAQLCSYYFLHFYIGDYSLEL